MRFLRVVAVGPSYARDFYDRHPQLVSASHEEQQKALDFDHYAWGDGWNGPLGELGYEAAHVYADVSSLARAWARENLRKNSENVECASAAYDQIVRFHPDIVFYDSTDPRLLSMIREGIPSIKSIIGWEGSAISRGQTWGHLDMIASCAPETVDEFRRKGLKGGLLSHAFNPDITRRMEPPAGLGTCRVLFVGNLITRNQFHAERIRILKRLREEADLRIHSPSFQMDPKEEVKIMIASAVDMGMRLFYRMGVGPETVDGNVLLKRLSRVATPLQPSAWRQFHRELRPPVYGLPYYQAMRDSMITLNAHADSSPRFASNMKLFEATGVGSCLLTDWRPNISDFFEEDHEVVTYRNPEECLEKIRWLLANPEARDEIARRGRDRVEKEHTFKHRSHMLDHLIKESLKTS